MIKEKTVLILGAGASMPYGFPSGPALKKTIWKTIAHEAGGYEYILESLNHKRVACGFEAHIKEFGEKLRQSPFFSVDLFLERHPSFVEVGKIAIATILLPFEKMAGVQPTEEEQDWYPLLFRYLESSPDKFSENNITIITFNYDRSLEHYLYTSLLNGYEDSTANSCAEILNKLNIIHIHGKLGGLPWENNVVEYGEMYKYESYRADNAYPLNCISRAADNIKIMFENNNEDEAIKEAYLELSSAGKILCLGFGYHEANLQHLGLLSNINSGNLKPEIDISTTIHGTSHGLFNKEKAIIKRIRKSNNSNFLFELEDTKIYKFFAFDENAILH
jgi:hypothetical protein